MSGKLFFYCSWCYKTGKVFATAQGSWLVKLCFILFSWRMMRASIFSSLSLYLKLLWQFCKSLAKTSGWQCIALAPQKQKWQGWPHKNADLDDLSWCVNNEGWLWTVPWLRCSMFTHSHASHVPSHCTSEPLRCHNLPTNHTFMCQIIQNRANLCLPYDSKYLIEFMLHMTNIAIKLPIMFSTDHDSTMSLLHTHFFSEDFLCMSLRLLSFRAWSQIQHWKTFVRNIFCDFRIGWSVKQFEGVMCYLMMISRWPDQNQTWPPTH